MCLRVLARKKMALELDYTLTLDTVNNIGNLYSNQGKLAEAEQMYLWALAGYEKALEPSAISGTVVILGRSGATKIPFWEIMSITRHDF